MTRIAVDVDELEALARHYERSAVELAGITLDLRQRLGSDLLDRVRAYGLPTRSADYGSERVCGALTAHVGELERSTLELERVWAEASGLARDGRLTSTAATPNLWWFRVAGSPVPPDPGSQAFAAASATGAATMIDPLDPLDLLEPAAPGTAEATVLKVGSNRGGELIAAAPGTWEEIDRYLLSLGIGINTPPEDWQTTGGRHSPTSYHYRSRARDFSYGMGCDEAAIAAALRPFCGSGIVELFHAPTGIWYPVNVGAHEDHIHAAIAENFRFPT